MITHHEFYFFLGIFVRVITLNLDILAASKKEKTRKQNPESTIFFEGFNRIHEYILVAFFLMSMVHEDLH